MKPLFVSMIFLNKFYTQKELDKLVGQKFDYMNWSEHLKKVWVQKKLLLKDKNYIK